MRKGKILWGVALLAAVCLLLCACGGGSETEESSKPEQTVVFRDEDAVTELYRATYQEGESEPTFNAPEKDGKTFEKWIVLVDENNMKVYQASYLENPAPPAPTPEPAPVTPTPEPVTPAPAYPVTLANGITVRGGTPGVDGQNCENLFDGDDNTCWCVDMSANSPAYVEWSMPSPVDIYGLNIRTAEDSAMNPQVWKASFSSDGQNWTDMSSATAETNSVTNANTYYRQRPIFHNAADNYNVFVPTAQYFRLEVEQTQGSSMLKIAGFGIMTEEPEES
ncbi:MAG: discoidin domain-containing protein [Oscillibacter sp.]|nr:discoidin domain-containing protein [Oscillibacter sp.]